MRKNDKKKNKENTFIAAHLAAVLKIDAKHGIPQIKKLVKILHYGDQ